MIEITEGYLAGPDGYLRGHQGHAADLGRVHGRPCLRHGMNWLVLP